MKYATVLQRIAAWIIDLIILFFVAIFVMGFSFVSSLFMMNVGFIVGGILSMILIVFVYTIALETAWNGQTVGKKIVKIRVVKENGKSITFTEALIRNIFRIIDNQFVGLVGLILILVTEKKQRIGDLIAKTVVIQE